MPWLLKAEKAGVLPSSLPAFSRVHLEEEDGAEWCGRAWGWSPGLTCWANRQSWCWRQSLSSPSGVFHRVVASLAQSLQYHGCCRLLLSCWQSWFCLSVKWFLTLSDFWWIQHAFLVFTRTRTYSVPQCSHCCWVFLCSPFSVFYSRCLSQHNVDTRAMNPLFS